LRLTREVVIDDGEGFVAIDARATDINHQLIRE
jgi:hypothetical protein